MAMAAMMTVELAAGGGCSVSITIADRSARSGVMVVLEFHVIRTTLM